MASGIVIHIASGQDRHTEVLSQDRVRIGPGDGYDVKLRGSSLPASSSLVIELARTNGHYRVTDFDASLAPTINGEPLAPGDAIDDGDEVRFSDSNFALQFFPVRDLPAVVPQRRSIVAPFIEHAAMEAASTERRDDAKVFLREFTRELLREINTSTKIVALLITVSLVGGILYLGQSANKELQRSRDLINKQNEQLVQLQGALNKTNEQFEQVDKSNKNIIESMSLAPRLFSQYGNGVCLITGTYILVEAGTGRPLRYPETQTAEDGTVSQSGGEQPILTPDGGGDPYVADFVGTGFHVGNGYIVTNRHLAVEPWTANENVQTLSASVQGQFRITRLVAFFPGQTRAFPMRLRQSSTRDDLAVTQIEAAALPATLPSLPLDKESDAAGVGKTIVMIGYPSGQDRLLATLPEAESRNVIQRSGASIESLLTVLAGRKAIKPLTTQGHITDLEERRVVYDARNAAGGSGSPLFGQSGRVIGINFATFTGLPDTNFAVPIRFAYPLLTRAGWKPAEPPADANSNVSPAKDTRAVSPQTNQSR